MTSQPFKPVLPVATVLAILLGLGVNALSNRYPPLGVTIAQLSNTRFAEVLIIPANYAFAIWGLIYLGLLAYGGYQLLQRYPSAALQRSRIGIIGASLAQVAWVVLFLYQYFLGSMLAMLAILGALLWVYEGLVAREADGFDDVPAAPRPLQRLTHADQWFLYRPISLYLGWISVATIVNAAIALYELRGNSWGLPPTLWTVILMAIATGIAVTLIQQREDEVFALVVVWAMVAIALKSLTIPLIAVGGLGLSAGLMGYLAYRQWLQ
jgi:hypothetical protein